MHIAYTELKRLNILNNKQNVIKVSVGGRISLDAWIENGARSNLEIQTGVLYFTHNSGVYIFCLYIILMSGKMGGGGGGYFFSTGGSTPSPIPSHLKGLTNRKLSYDLKIRIDTD